MRRPLDSPDGSSHERREETNSSYVSSSLQIAESTPQTDPFISPLPQEKSSMESLRGRRGTSFRRRRRKKKTNVGEEEGEQQEEKEENSIRGRKRNERSSHHHYDRSGHHMTHDQQGEEEEEEEEEREEGMPSSASSTRIHSSCKSSSNHSTCRDGEEREIDNPSIGPIPTYLTSSPPHSKPSPNISRRSSKALPGTCSFSSPDLHEPVGVSCHSSSPYPLEESNHITQHARAKKEKRKNVSSRRKSSTLLSGEDVHLPPSSSSFSAVRQREEEEKEKEGQGDRSNPRLEPSYRPSFPSNLPSTHPSYPCRPTTTTSSSLSSLHRSQGSLLPNPSSPDQKDQKVTSSPESKILPTCKEESCSLPSSSFHQSVQGEQILPTYPVETERRYEDLSGGPSRSLYCSSSPSSSSPPPPPLLALPIHVKTPLSAPSQSTGGRSRSHTENRSRSKNRLQKKEKKPSHSGVCTPQSRRRNHPVSTPSPLTQERNLTSSCGKQHLLSQKTEKNKRKKKSMMTAIDNLEKKKIFTSRGERTREQHEEEEGRVWDNATREIIDKHVQDAASITFLSSKEERHAKISEEEIYDHNTERREEEEDAKKRLHDSSLERSSKSSSFLRDKDRKDQEETLFREPMVSPCSPPSHPIPLDHQPSLFSSSSSLGPSFLSLNDGSVSVCLQKREANCHSNKQKKNKKKGGEDKEPSHFMKTRPGMEEDDKKRKKKKKNNNTTLLNPSSSSLLNPSSSLPLSSSPSSLSPHLTHLSSLSACGQPLLDLSSASPIYETNSERNLQAEEEQEKKRQENRETTFGSASPRNERRDFTDVDTHPFLSSSSSLSAYPLLATPEKDTQSPLSVASHPADPATSSSPRAAVHDESSSSPYFPGSSGERKEAEEEEGKEKERRRYNDGEGGKKKQERMKETHAEEVEEMKKKKKGVSSCPSTTLDSFDDLADGLVASIPRDSERKKASDQNSSLGFFAEEEKKKKNKKKHERKKKIGSTMKEEKRLSVGDERKDDAVAAGMSPSVCTRAELEIRENENYPTFPAHSMQEETARVHEDDHLYSYSCHYSNYLYASPTPQLYLPPFSREMNLSHLSAQQDSSPFSLDPSYSSSSSSYLSSPPGVVFHRREGQEEENYLYPNPILSSSTSSSSSSTSPSQNVRVFLPMNDEPPRSHQQQAPRMHEVDYVSPPDSHSANGSLINQYNDNGLMYESLQVKRTEKMKKKKKGDRKDKRNKKDGEGGRGGGGDFGGKQRKKRQGQSERERREERREEEKPPGLLLSSVSPSSTSLPMSGRKLKLLQRGTKTAPMYSHALKEKEEERFPLTTHGENTEKEARTAIDGRRDEEGEEETKKKKKKEEEEEEEKKKKQREIETCIERILKLLGEDPSRGGLRETPRRVARALQFFVSGYLSNLQDIVKGAVFHLDGEEGESEDFKEAFVTSSSSSSSSSSTPTNEAKEEEGGGSPLRLASHDYNGVAVATDPLIEGEEEERERNRRRRRRSERRGMVVIRGLNLHSLCEHHLLPFFGKCHIA
ncbi:gtp cyclohydrolase i [Cystoisospora suis]|uniref:GTP cyclohydrolase 1 n=1 Tax=Cystoisospora suis TaxID=483139 RepID=A0A2C6L8M8_9APIC|nr:gtp cyclohydrolase i [Cystoisospora suis]